MKGESTENKMSEKLLVREFERARSLSAFIRQQFKLSNACGANPAWRAECREIHMTKDIIFIRLAEVIRRTGLPRASIYELMAEGRFPKPVPLAERSVGWIEAEIVSWQEARIAERDRQAHA